MRKAGSTTLCRATMPSLKPYTPTLPPPTSPKITRAAYFGPAQATPRPALTDQAMDQSAAWGMIRRRAAAAGIHTPIGNHSFRATGITAYLGNGGTLEHAQEMAGHESPRTTKLYDRTKERLTQDEVERIRL